MFGNTEERKRQSLESWKLLLSNGNEDLTVDTIIKS
jgi:hypothetical protein